nr:MAG TPA: hypothetical protein [Caudoviricetes sp.]
MLKLKKSVILRRIAIVNFEICAIFCYVGFLCLNQ